MAHTNWYRYGTISINQNSNHVIGLNTRWADIGIKSGDVFTLDGTKIYEVDTVTDNTNLTLKTAFEESNRADVHYCIIRNFTDISTADIVAQMSELRVEMKTYIDTEMSTLQGKSAYEIAQDNGFIGTESEWLASLNAYGIAKKGGYTGTESEWLNSLKAAGEWEEADTRISTLESSTADYSELKKAVAAAYESPDFIFYDRSYQSTDKTEPYQTTCNFGKQFLHKSIYRGKNLGTHPTEAQLANVKNGTYEDLYLGDYWEDDIDITYPVLDGADADNGDTFTNEATGRRLVGKVRWVVVDMGYLATYSGARVDNNPLEGATYCNTANLGNIVVMPTTQYALQKLATFCKADGTTKTPYGLGSFPMNYKNSNECGYRYSIVRTKILPAIYEYLLNNWGLSADHFRWHEVFSSTNSTSSVNDNYPLHLPAFSQIMGGLSNIQIKNTPANWTMGHYDLQFQLFKLGGIGMMRHLWWNVEMITRDMFAGNTVSFVNLTNGGVYTHTNSNSALTERNVTPYLILY